MLSFYSEALLLLSVEGRRQRKDEDGERASKWARERISGLTKLLRDLEKEKSLCSVLAVQLRGDMKQITRWRCPSTSFTLERPTLVLEITQLHSSKSLLKGPSLSPLCAATVCLKSFSLTLVSRIFLSLSARAICCRLSSCHCFSLSVYLLLFHTHRKCIFVPCFITKTCILFINRYLC